MMNVRVLLPLIALLVGCQDAKELIHDVSLAQTKWTRKEELKVAPPWRLGGVHSEKFVVAVDTQIASEARSSIRISNDSTEYGYVVVYRREDPDKFRNTVVEITASVRTELRGEMSWAGLLVRADSGGTMLDYDHMHHRKIRDSTEWKDYSVTVRVPSGAESVRFGVSQSGLGKTWMDNVRWVMLDTIDKASRVQYDVFAPPYNSDFEWYTSVAEPANE
jgi:hypothetical protein